MVFFGSSPELWYYTSGGWTTYVVADPIHKGVHMALTETNREELIPRYAVGEITWGALHPREAQMLGALGEFSLRPAGAPMEGPKVEPHRCDREAIREALPNQGR